MDEQPFKRAVLLQFTLEEILYKYFHALLPRSHEATKYFNDIKLRVFVTLWLSSQAFFFFASVSPRSNLTTRI